VVQAPGEGEAQAAALASRGATWATASEDYDSLLFGAPRLVRGLAARARSGSAPGAQLIDRADLLASLGIDGDELIALGIVMGTDFNEGADGFGPKKALKLVREHLGFERTIERAGLDLAEAQAVAAIFRSPQVADTGPLSFGPVDEVGLHRMLVETHGFSESRFRAAVARARSRPQAATSPEEARGHQTLLETFGGVGE